jgi:pilus assembly protein CpaC
MRLTRISLAFTATVLLGTAAQLYGSTSAYAEEADSNYIKINESAIGHTQRVQVGLNKSMVIDLPGDAHDILVANPEVADAVTRTSRRIYIFAKQVGETNIFIFDGGGRQLLGIDLHIERDIAGLEANLEKYLPGSDINVEIVNDNIILTGTVPTPQDSARAVELAQVFVTGGEATTGNYSSNFDTSGANGSTIIFGLGEDTRAQSQIVNLLQIDGEDQVNLKVTIAEIQRTVVKQLGIDITGVINAGGDLAFSLLTDNPFTLNKPMSNSSAVLGYSHDEHSTHIDSILRAIDQAGLMRTLAEPSLTAISGETAYFRVGGEYNLSNGKSEDDDSVTYEFKEIEYGVGLSFTPVVLSPGRISLRIRSEVSEPTSEGNYVIPRGGAPAAPAPGVRRRVVETTVELPSGGSMVIAGLLKDDVRQTASGYPGLHRIPVLGTLFKSREFQRFETELVILVTPYLVRPVARQKLARPDDNFNPTGDAAGIFLGRVNQIYGAVDSVPPEGQYNGKVGFIYK